MEKLLEIEYLTKVFTLGSILSRAHITAVDNISFFLKPAEIFTLAGESGCGKTTTARIVLGFESPTSGSMASTVARRKQRMKRYGSLKASRPSFKIPFPPSIPCV